MRVGRLSFTLLCFCLAAVLVGCGSTPRKTAQQPTPERVLDADGFLVTWRAPLSPESDLTVEVHSMASRPDQSSSASISVAFNAIMPDGQVLAADTPPWRILIVDAEGATREIAGGRRQKGAPAEFTSASGGAIASLPPDARTLVLELNVGRTAADAEKGVRIEVPVDDIPRYDEVQVNTTWERATF